MDLNTFVELRTLDKMSFDINMISNVSILMSEYGFYNFLGEPIFINCNKKEFHLIFDHPSVLWKFYFEYSGYKIDSYLFTNFTSNKQHTFFGTLCKNITCTNELGYVGYHSSNPIHWFDKNILTCYELNLERKNDFIKYRNGFKFIQKLFNQEFLAKQIFNELQNPKTNILNIRNNIVNNSLVVENLIKLRK